MLSRSGNKHTCLHVHQPMPVAPMCVATVSTLPLHRCRQDVCRQQEEAKQERLAQQGKQEAVEQLVQLLRAVRMQSADVSLERIHESACAC